MHWYIWLSCYKRFYCFETEIKKLDFNKLANIPTSFNNLRPKINDLDVDKLKSIPVDFKKISNVEDNETVKNTKFNTLKTKLNIF